MMVTIEDIKADKDPNLTVDDKIKYLILNTMDINNNDENLVDSLVRLFKLTYSFCREIYPINSLKLVNQFKFLLDYNPKYEDQSVNKFTIKRDGKTYRRTITVKKYVVKTDYYSSMFGLILNGAK